MEQGIEGKCLANNYLLAKNLLFPTYQGVGVVRQSVVDIIADKFYVRFYNLQWNIESVF